MAQRDKVAERLGGLGDARIDAGDGAAIGLVMRAGDWSVERSASAASAGVTRISEPLSDNSPPSSCSSSR